MTHDETIQDPIDQDAAGQHDVARNTAPPEPPTHPSPYAASRTMHQPPATLADDPMRRSPFIAATLSLMPGLGQVYTGYTRLGFVHAIVVAVVLAFLSGVAHGAVQPLLAVFLTFFWLYGVVDAARRAMLVNQALLGRLHMNLPEALGEPGFRGSLAGGVTLVAVGALLLSNTLFNVSLAWVEDWWPVALIGFGAFLAYRAIEDRKASGEA